MHSQAVKSSLVTIMIISTTHKSEIHVTIIFGEKNEYFSNNHRNSWSLCSIKSIIYNSVTAYSILFTKISMNIHNISKFSLILNILHRFQYSIQKISGEEVLVTALYIEDQSDVALV